MDFNFSEEQQKVWIGDEEIYLNLMTGEEKDAGVIQLGGGDFCWMLHKFQ